MRTLLIVSNSHVARAMGMGVTTNHRQHGTDCRFWWPDLGAETLRGLQVDLIVVDSVARRKITPDEWAALRAYMFRPDVIVLGDV